jgi:hypothetical protein
MYIQKNNNPHSQLNINLWIDTKLPPYASNNLEINCGSKTVAYSWADFVYISKKISTIYSKHHQKSNVETNLPLGSGLS